ncbi:uncharacterized protein LOC123268202 [Cotesia glomerata]|uniref:Uncharacterized protein n=1 Tax=Cotesia glomerata TaxID=32391 RepID=A0AAV7HR65_COTGL|nr:uncharacterized protein LOC123268202 [Cotesia glomerata]XP_044589062.1 uncharacterized protein LOC123268202 [Cotesia glomerata]KAH0534355.1 hypothetical protein KQX54_003294 [Cotesia glomerata]
MGKLPALALLVLLISASYPEAQAFSFGNIFNIGSIVKNIIGTVADIVGVFVPQKLAPDHSKEYRQFENDLLGQNKKLKEIYEKVDDSKDRTMELEKKLKTTADNLKKMTIGAQTREIQVLDMMNRIDDVIKKTNILTYSVTDVLTLQINDTVRKLGTMADLDSNMEALHKDIVEISDSFETLVKRTTKRESMSERSFQDFLKSIVSYKNRQPRDIMQNIWALFQKSAITDDLPSTFVSYVKQQSFEEKCDKDSTFQDKLKGIYNLVMITEFRHFLMQVVSYKYISIIDPVKNGNIRNDVNKFVEKLIHKSQDYIRIMKEAFAKIPTDIMRCDPAVHLKDDNNFELNNLFGAYYINVAQLDIRCDATCDQINVKRDLECVSVPESQSGDVVPYYCPQFQCKGRLHSCKKANSYSFCESQIPNEQRYRWITENPSKSMISSCDGNYINTMTQARCDSCMCLCSEEGAESDATRTVSLLPQMSDYKNNMVVTNVRFQKRDNVVHIQIEEGELLPEGRIKHGSQRWVPLKKFVYSRNTPEGSFSIVDGNDLLPLIPNDNFTFLSHDNRRLMLHDIKVDTDKVVTGVRFFLKKDNSIDPSKLIIMVHATKFDYFTGEVRHEKPNAHKWYDYEESRCTYCTVPSLTEANLNGRGNPMGSLRNVDVSGANQFLMFRASGNDNPDHMTIPFFDSRPAGIASHTALSGIGILHRSSRGYGGFLAPKLLGIDHSFAMTYELSYEKIESYKWH